MENEQVNKSVGEMYIYVTNDNQIGVGETVSESFSGKVKVIESQTNGNSFTINNEKLLILDDMSNMKWSKYVDVHVYNQIKILIYNMAKIHMDNINLSENEVEFLNKYYTNGFRTISVGRNKIAMKRKNVQEDNFDFKLFKQFSTVQLYSLRIGEKYDIKSLLCYVGKRNIYKDKEYGAIKIENNIGSLDFVDDIEKMRDFFKLTKDDFLESYIYISEEEYDSTYSIVVGKVNKTTELCPHCDTEIAMHIMIEECSHCGKWIVRCNACHQEHKNCDTCKLNKLADELNKINSNSEHEQG